MATTLLPEIESLRQASREMVRELGFMQHIYAPAEMPHSHCHALMEVELFGTLHHHELSERLRLDKSTTSRIVQNLVKENLVQVSVDPEDQRRKVIQLTAEGKVRLAKIHRDANQRVQSALEQLSFEQRQQVTQGISLYSQALQKARVQSDYVIRLIEIQDAPAVAQLIRKVMPEFGACGPGFAINDPEVDDMYTAYTQVGAQYFVVCKDEKIVGGGGFAALEGGPDKVCELRKMYFMPELRGKGIGQRLISLCLESAKKMGYQSCYLETLINMKQARALYTKNGFEPLEQPMGKTGHFGCDAWYIKHLG